MNLIDIPLPTKTAQKCAFCPVRGLHALAVVNGAFAPVCNDCMAYNAALRVAQNPPTRGPSVTAERSTLPLAQVTTPGGTVAAALVTDTPARLAWLDLATLALTTVDDPAARGYACSLTGGDVTIPLHPHHRSARRIARVYAALRDAGGNRTRAGDVLGLSRQAVVGAVADSGWLARLFPGAPGNPRLRQA